VQRITFWDIGVIWVEAFDVKRLRTSYDKRWHHRRADLALGRISFSGGQKARPYIHQQVQTVGAARPGATEIGQCPGEKNPVWARGFTCPPVPRLPRKLSERAGLGKGGRVPARSLFATQGVFNNRIPLFDTKVTGNHRTLGLEEMEYRPLFTGECFVVTLSFTND